MKRVKFKYPNVRDHKNELILPFFYTMGNDADDDREAASRISQIGNHHAFKIARDRYDLLKHQGVKPNIAYEKSMTFLANYRDRTNPRWSTNPSPYERHPDYEVTVPKEIWDSPEYPAWAVTEYDDEHPEIPATTIKEHVKYVLKQNIINSLFENAKFARRGGGGRQRPKSWNKGTKSGSEKKKSRREGKNQAREAMYEDLTPQKRWELYQELKHEDTPEFRQRQHEAVVRGIVQNMAPIYQRHGIGEEHLQYTTDHGFPALGSFMNHPNFEAFTLDFIDYHTQQNREHWKTHNRASPIHWPAVKFAKKQLESFAKRKEYLSRTSDLTEDAEELEAELDTNSKSPHPIEIMLKNIKYQKMQQQANDRNQSGQDY